VVRRIFGPKRDDAAGEWRRIHIEELHMYSSPNIIWVTRSRILRWMGNVVRIETDRRRIYMDLMGKREGKRQLGRFGVDKSSILKGILMKSFARA
jgi:hypothetical protein